LYETLGKCPLCGAAASEELFRVRDSLSAELLRLVPRGEEAAFLNATENRLVRCAGCGLAYLDPRLDGPTLGRLYDLWYRHGYPRLIENPPVLAALANEARNYHFPLVSAHCAARPRLLDVGCGSGLFLAVCQEHGWDAQGIESNEHAARRAASAGLKVWQADFLSFAPPEGGYDVVTMFDLIEHVTDPVANLAAAHRLLAPGGLLVARTPNLGGLQARVLKERWYGVIANHLLYFDAATLRRLFTSCGFEVLATSAPNYTTLGALLARQASYVTSKLKRPAPTPQGPTAQSASSGEPSPTPKKRLGTYLFGVVMELVDYTGGALGRGNNLTIVAKKK
jgi:SAM-dependent methyltransferase